MIVYGRNVLREALRAGYPIHEIRLSPEAEVDLADLLSKRLNKTVVLKRVNARELDSWTEGAAHQGIAARIKDFEEYALEDVLKSPPENGPIVFLDQAQDPRNFGAIARTALAAGAKGLVMPKRRSAPISAVALKAAAGAFFQLKAAYETNLARALDKVKGAGYWIYGTDAKAEKDIYQIDFTPQVALVLGGEGEGMRQLVRSKCDFIFRIPMTENVESLNVSVAAAIVLYEIFRRRNKG